MAALFWSGCATSTLESRRQQRYSTYAALSPEHRAAVDAAQIKVGMPMDAVYIAWGKPSQVLNAESAAGHSTVWLYYGTYLQSYTYWTHAPYCGPYHYHHYGPVFRHDYHPVSYVRAEVVFENGVVKQWRTLPAPGY